MEYDPFQIGFRPIFTDFGLLVSPGGYEYEATRSESNRSSAAGGVGAFQDLVIASTCEILGVFIATYTSEVLGRNETTRGDD